MIFFQFIEHKLVFQNFFYQIKNSYLTPEIFYFNFCPDFMSSHVIF